MTSTEQRGRALALAATVGLAGLVPSGAGAVPGFYAARGGSGVHARTTSVVVMRDREETVLSIRADVHGAAGDVVLVVPVPSEIGPGDVRTLPHDPVARLEWATAPRLVERWEQDPCAGTRDAAPPEEERGAAPEQGEGAAADYEIAIVRGGTPSALTSWLREHGYAASPSVASRLARYARASRHFVVARAPASRRDPGRPLPPLRLRYRSRALVSLPLALDGSGVVEDVVVHVIARQRHEAASGANVDIPVTLDATRAALASFDDAYAALFERVLASRPGAVVTEHAGAAGDALSWRELEMLGADVVFADPRSLPEPSSRRIEVRARAPRVAGALSAAQVADTARRHTAEIRYCYQDEAQRSGVVTVRATIDASGAVRTARAVGASLGAPRVSDCVAGAVRGWRFPPAAGATTAQLPFLLTSRVDGDAVAAPTWARRAELARQLVVTRMHLRSDPRRSRDLVLRPVPAARRRDLAARYVVRHAWDGAIACSEPSRGVWVPRARGGGPATVAGRVAHDRTGGAPLEAYFPGAARELGRGPRSE